MLEYALNRSHQLSGFYVGGGGVKGALEELDEGRGHDRHGAAVNSARLAVYGNDIALGNKRAVGAHKVLCLDIDNDVLSGHDTSLAHAAGDNGSVAGLAAAAGQYPFRGHHSRQVVGVGLGPHQHDRFAFGGPASGRRRIENCLANCCSGAGAHASDERSSGRRLVETREHELGQAGAANASQCLVHRDDRLVYELGGDPEGSGGRTLADASLQHPQLAVLNRELDIAQVAVVVLEGRHYLEQLLVDGRVQVLQFLERHGVADPGDDVFTLGILEVVTINAAVARGRVAGKRHPGTGAQVEVAEDHRNHRYRGAQVIGYPLLPAVNAGALAVPGPEDGRDGEIELLAGRHREIAASFFVDDIAVRRHEVSQVVDAEVEIGRCSPSFLQVRQSRFEQTTVNTHDCLAEHLDQAPV